MIFNNQGVLPFPWHFLASFQECVYVLPSSRTSHHIAVVSVPQFCTCCHCPFRNTDGLQLLISMFFLDGCCTQMSSWEEISMHPLSQSWAVLSVCHDNYLYCLFWRAQELPQGLSLKSKVEFFKKKLTTVGYQYISAGTSPLLLWSLLQVVSGEV